MLHGPFIWCTLGGTLRWLKKSICKYLSVGDWSTFGCKLWTREGDFVRTRNITRFTMRSISHSRLPQLNAWGSSAGPGTAAIMQEGSDQQQPVPLPPILSTIPREHSLPPHLMYEVIEISYACSIEKRQVLWLQWRVKRAFCWWNKILWATLVVVYCTCSGMFLHVLFFAAGFTTVLLLSLYFHLCTYMASYKLV